MNKPVLLYDGKCQVCRNLALKIHYHSKTAVDIVALSDPEAARMLQQFYPNGWKHDFYIVQNGTCRRGLRALPAIMSNLGTRQFASLIGEYAGYKIVKSTCGHDHQHSSATSVARNGGASRRQVIAMAAAAPLLMPLTRLPRLRDPFDDSGTDGIPRIDGNVAVVWRDASDFFRSQVRSLRAAIQPSGDFKRSNGEAKILRREQTVLEESLGSEAAQQGTVAAQAAPSDAPRFVVRHTRMEGERTSEGVTHDGFVDFYGVAVDHGRYNIAINVGIGTVLSGDGPRVAASMSGMIRHDLPLPLIDYVVLAEQDDAAAQLRGFTEGFRALERFHADAGRERIAQLYQTIESGLTDVVGIYERNVSDPLVPLASKLAITSMPELMKFVDLKSEVDRIGETVPLSGKRPRSLEENKPCECACTCGCCCGCGCGCGAGTCGVECICGCSCCCDCGCACGCCLLSLG